jgi:hypothetical protein
MTEIIELTQHPGQGFYSCCSILLDSIIKYFNDNKKLPLAINNTNMFIKYNPSPSLDITNIYFNIPVNPVLEYRHDIVHSPAAQFEPFGDVNFADIEPIIKLFFSPSDSIKQVIKGMEAKYSIDYDNTCVLFYRGLDKCTELTLPPYEAHLKDAQNIHNNDPRMRFIIQSDETEYIQYMSERINNSFIFDEIRHTNKQLTCVDHLCTVETNLVYSQYFLAIVYIMAKCKYVICNSGNISVWISYFRCNSNNIIQHI